MWGDGCKGWAQGLLPPEPAERTMGPKEVATSPCLARDDLLAARGRLRRKEETAPCVNPLRVAFRNSIVGKIPQSWVRILHHKVRWG